MQLETTGLQLLIRRYLLEQVEVQLLYHHNISPQHYPRQILGVNMSATTLTISYTYTMNSAIYKKTPLRYYQIKSTTDRTQKTRVCINIREQITPEVPEMAAPVCEQSQRNCVINVSHTNPMVCVRKLTLATRRGSSDHASPSSPANTARGPPPSTTP